jgi:hypothetical protein
MSPAIGQQFTARVVGHFVVSVMSSSSLKVIYANLDKKRGQFRNLFKTQDGQAVLKALHEEFNQLDIMAATPERTAYNLGGRDVVMYIEQLLKEKEEGHE